MSKLFLVGTPIGNLEDITLRAIKTLKECDLIMTEDKRVAVKLLNKLEIKDKELFTFNEATSKNKLPLAIEKIKSVSKTCLISDAGMPVISDPGANLAETCIENGIEVDVIPGPSATVTALAASGFPGSKFTFHGFIPRDKNRRRLLRKIVEDEYIQIFFESPNRILKTLKDILQILGDRDIFIAREMTKMHQDLFRGNITQAIEYYENKDSIKGEFTVVLSGKR